MDDKEVIAMAGRPGSSTATRVPRALALLGAIGLLAGLALAADISSAKNLRGTKSA